mgnify:CR=1 FL=1
MGRWSNERRAQEAAKAAAKADKNAQKLISSEPPPEAPLEISTPEYRDSGEHEPDHELDKTRKGPRDFAMEEIEKRDLESKGLPAQAPEEEGAETPPAQIPEQSLEGGKVTSTPAEVPPEPAPGVPETPTPPPVIETVRIKVDGEEFDAPKDEVDAAGGIHAYQRDKAAENRLKKTNDVLAEVRRTQAMLAEFARQQLPQTPTLTTDQLIASKIDTIRFGTPEESAAALKEVLQHSNPKVDQNILIEQAVAEINYRSGLAKFKAEFNDIAVNPMLMKLVNSVAHERAANIPKDPHSLAGLDWADFYRRIGNEVRSVISRPSQPANAPAATTPGSPSQVTPDREARKASIVNLPTAATRAELPKETKPETREDTLNEMRKSRGIPTG